MTGILTANILPEFGTVSGYLWPGQVRTNLAHIGCKSSQASDPRFQMPVRPNALVSVDILTYGLYTGECLLIECFDLKVVPLRRKFDGAEQGVQMWCMVGTKDAQSNFYPLTLDTDMKTMLYWTDGWEPTNNPNDQFDVIIDGIGTPYAFHEFFDRPYIVNTWYWQAGHRQFWAARHTSPTQYLNPDWTGPDKEKLSMQFQEAWWAEVAGGWQFGDGEIVDNWPRPFDGAQHHRYGALEVHALWTTPMWHAHVWKPTLWSENALWLE